MLLLRHGSEAGGEPAEDREGQRWVIEERPFEIPRRERKATRRLGRYDLGDARQPVEHRQLAEELAGAQNRQFFAVADDPDRAIDDEEKASPDLALPSDDSIGRKLDLDGLLRDRCEVGRRHPSEQPTGTEQLGSPVPGERQRNLLLNCADAAAGRVRRQPVPRTEWQVEWQNARRETPHAEERIAMASRLELVDQIAGFALFADLETPQLERVAHTFEERLYQEGERVLRQGLSGSAFHIILDGDARVVIDGEERATLSRGDFFGEVSILLGEPPVADVVAVRELRCLVLAGAQVRPFLIDNPPIMYRMLQAQARRLRNANRWRS